MKLNHDILSVGREFGLFLLLTLVGLPGLAQTWNPLSGFSAGFGDFIGQNQASVLGQPLAVGKDAKPYLIFENWQNRKTAVLQYSGSSWDTLGGQPLPAALIYGSVSLTNDGIPFVVFQDSTYGYRPTVMKFDGNSWQTVGSAGFAPDSFVNTHPEMNYTCIALDNSGAPYIAYANGLNGNKAEVMKFDGNHWVQVGQEGISDGAAGFLSLALNPANGMPYIAFLDQAHGNKATVMKFDGLNWATVGSAGFTADSVQSASLAIDQSGIPYLAYLDAGNELVAKVVRFNNGNWSELGNTSLLTPFLNHVQIAVGRNNTPYIVEQSINAVSVLTFNGLDWEPVGNPVSEGVHYGSSNCYYAALAIDGADNLYAAYYFTPMTNMIYPFCMAEVKEYEAITTGIGATYPGTNALTLFPNPNRGIFSVKLPQFSKEEPVIITVVDAFGRTIWVQQVEGQNKESVIGLNMGNGLSSGAYFLNVRASDFSKTIPFVKY